MRECAIERLREGLIMLIGLKEPRATQIVELHISNWR